MLTAAKKIADSVVKQIARKLSPLPSDAVEKTFPARQSYQPTPPVNIAMFSEALVAPFLVPVQFHAHSVYQLHNVYVTWNGGVFRNLRLFEPSLVHGYYAETFQDTLLLRQWIGNKVEAPKAGIAICHNQWSVENYYHWLADTLPRLLILRQLHPNMPLALPQPLPPKQMPEYIRHTAEALGFTEFVPVNPRQILQAERVVVPALTATPISQNPELIRQVRAELRAAYSPAPRPATRRVYAARSTTGVRKIVNEAAVDEMMAVYGFEKVYFERFSFLEQIELMHETAVLLGVHGAGLTNMFFLQPGAKVLEMLDEVHQVHCYYWLASCFEMPYYLIPCRGVDPEKTSHSDLLVDINLLQQVIEQALSEG